MSKQIKTLGTLRILCTAVLSMSVALAVYTRNVDHFVSGALAIMIVWLPKLLGYR